MKQVGLLLAGALSLPGALAAQSFTVGASRWLKSPHIMEYRVGVGGLGRGPVRLVYSGQYLTGSGTSKAHWYGVGGDLILRPISSAQPYLIVGGAVGAGRGKNGGGEKPGVGAWGGIGAEIVTVGPIALQAEALYQWRSGIRLSGASIGLRLGTPFGHRPVGTPMNPSDVPRANPSDEEAIRLATEARKSNTPAGEIVATALTVMGTPYKWGGTDTLGFDCSGLIRYAYGQHGVTLPRMAVDQARTGSEVGRGLDQLLPGDILTFSDQPGGPVTHVGLYVGDGQFIHSARGGVQISALSESDSIGKWWYARWVGARRIMDGR